MSKKIKNLVNLRIESEEQLSSFIDKIVSEDIGKFKAWASGRSSRKRNKPNEEIEDGIIEGEKFTVKGITFQSMPSKLGATRAMQLYNSCGGCGDKTPGPDGKDLIGTIIYDKVKPGSSSKYAPRLGTPRESFWSSWYFGAAYGEDPAYHKVWSNRGIGYPAKKAFKIRNDVFQNPTKYKGSAFYMLFHIKEAPIFAGDAIFHWRAESSGKGFGDIGGGGPSHMKIMGVDGNFYGGNEGHSYGKPGARKNKTTGSTVGKSSFNLDSQRRLAPGQPGTDPYMAVLKKVVIADNAPGATQDGQTNKPPEQTNESLKEDRKINEDIGSFDDSVTTTSKDPTEKKFDEHIAGNFVSNIPPGTVLAHPVGKLPGNNGQWPAGKTWERSSPAGPRTIRGKKGVHNANDFSCSTGTPVCAYADGIVTSSAYDDCGGKFITITHSFSWSDGDKQGPVKTQYLHLSKQNVNVNTHVKAGQIIGLSGNTGSTACTTGPHLHFTFKIGDSKSANQALYSKNLDDVPQMNCTDLTKTASTTRKDARKDARKERKDQRRTNELMSRIDKELLLSALIKNNL